MDIVGIWKQAMDNLEKVHQASGVPPYAMMAIGFVMFGAWTACYAVIIVRCFKQKTYGIPVVCSGMNICWEFIFSFNLAGALSWAIRWGNRFWLIPDTINVVQTYMYGPEMQPNLWVRKNFRTIVTLTLIACLIGDYLFLIYFNDVYGVLLSLLLDFVMSALFINMALQRSDLRGLSLSAAWLKMIGDMGTVGFLYFWWPAQFINGVLETKIHETIPVRIPVPPDWGFMYFLYVGIVALNGVFIYLIWKRKKELQAEAAAKA